MDDDALLALLLQQEEEALEKDERVARQLAQEEEDLRIAQQLMREDEETLTRQSEQDFKLAVAMGSTYEDLRRRHIEDISGTKVQVRSHYEALGGNSRCTESLDEEQAESEDEEDEDGEEDPEHFRYDAHGVPRLHGRVDKQNPQPRAHPRSFKQKKLSASNQIGKPGKLRWSGI
eukprot:NODE_3919_length_893_cov_33.273697_g3607_i0.p1 GENE.NODE_3919_length_893_cov_33.273697_g3607_i0~~NODE_3919_length_893_cov_33.273697_g3607_i0.p1  ORF type:complete len:175 (+),score=46.01 NODE_3919_length_893_cov_33.273697_g3607_i0:204-728(+)